LANGEEHAGLADNLFIDLTGGVDKPSGEESDGFGSIGANWGIPVNPGADGLALGLQLGGDAGLRDHIAEWDATVGPFARNFKVFGEQQGALAVLFDYLQTAQHNDLWAVRPIVGTTVCARDAVGLTGSAGLNEASKATVTITTATINRQELADYFEAFWNHNWNDRVDTEFATGYQFGGVDEALFRGEIVWGITPNADVSVGGIINTAGNYVCSVSISYHFGGIGRHDTLHNIYVHQQQDFYTPFPKRGAVSLDPRTAGTSFGPGGGGGFGGGGG
jgi:hypothetical protein